MARAARAARAVREDKSAGANFGNLSVLGETDLLQSISIEGSMGVGVPRCWCSLVLVFLGDEGKKIVPQIVSLIVPKPPQKIMFFAEVSALSEVLFKVLLNSNLNSTTKSL